MQISIREVDSIPVISISGEVDLYNAKEIKQVLDQKIQEGKYEIVVDVSEVPFMDSSGIGTLVTGMYKLRKYYGGLKVAGISGSVAKVFKLTGMESHLQVYESIEEAIQAFGKER